MRLMRLPASACIIVKNNPQIGILLRLLRDTFRELVVVDTGSTDQTAEIARALADKVEIFTDCNNPVTDAIEHFSLARTRSFNLATEEVIAWYDSDDEPRGLDHIGDEINVLKALRKQLGKPVLMRYDYDYSSNSGGIQVRHVRERLLLREDWSASAFAWHGRVHELLGSKGAAGGDETIALVNRPRETMVWIHRQAAAQGRETDRDLRILRLAIADEGGLDRASLRTLYCFAGECIGKKLWDEARWACEAYLARPGVTVERSLLLDYLAKIAQQEKNYDDALKYALLALANAQGDTPGGVESKGVVSEASKAMCFTVGSVYRDIATSTEEADRARHANLCAVRFFRMGLAMRDNLMTSSFPQTTFSIMLGLIDALRALDKEDEALAVVEDALVAVPGAPQFMKHRGELNLSTTKRAFTKSLERLHEWGAVSWEDCVGVSAIMNTAPNVAHSTTDPAPALVRTVAPGKFDIILACGETREVWNPEIVEQRGVGGSETAACDWARGMVARGHRVRVYTRCGATEAKVYDGVEYLPTAALEGSQADILVAWRFPQLLHKATNARGHGGAPVQILWAHDPGDFMAAQGQMLARTKVVVFSQWQKTSVLEAHPALTVDDVFVIPGAIRVEDFADGGTTRRSEHAAVCMSAHERHLMAFIDIWPRIRAQVPDATLDLFYGYDDWKRLPTNVGFAEQIRYFDSKRSMLESLGVTFHKRMMPKEIAQCLLHASVWLYPTSWPECWPAAAAQAQTAGLQTVTTKFGGIPEVVDDPHPLAPVDNTYDLLEGKGHPRGWNLEPRYQQAFVDRAVAALRYPLHDDVRLRMRQHATRRFGWSRYLDAWESLLKNAGSLAEKRG